MTSLNAVRTRAYPLYQSRFQRRGAQRLSLNLPFGLEDAVNSHSIKRAIARLLTLVQNTSNACIIQLSKKVGEAVNMLLTAQLSASGGGCARRAGEPSSRKRDDTLSCDSLLKQHEMTRASSTIVAGPGASGRSTQEAKLAPLKSLGIGSGQGCGAGKVPQIDPAPNSLLDSRVSWLRLRRAGLFTGGV